MKNSTMHVINAVAALAAVAGKLTHKLAKPVEGIPMRNVFATIAAFGLTAILGYASSAQTGPNLLPKNVKCERSSFAPEVITFYGDGNTVLEKLDSYQAHLSDRRVYMFIAETADSAEAELFERSSGEDVHVAHWRGASVGPLRDQISTTVLANRGIACIGEQVKSLVLKTLRPDDLGVIPAPVTVRAAFGHNIKAYGSDYMRVTVYLLC